ncbi:TetR/AcrR family transcriptional regulator [Pseudonocardia lacus]|uniref:TetR/AcrR family transcriptional regulator n=1 Tax=Pseudonocardia lacus TaxID=2835865 RepID=UPI0027E3492D|nr:helix-turn-helix domain-containing protein [Pseudonocardia lacus]
MSSESAERPRRLTRAEAKARTRALVLDAAARTFARKGFAGASVEEIAEAAGFSIGAVYSNFGSKERLFVELLSDRASGQVAEAERILAEQVEAGQSPLLALGRMLTEVADKDTDLGLLQAEFWLYAVRNPAALDTLAARMREPRDALAEIVSGALDPRSPGAGTSPTAVATVVMALFHGLVRQRRIDPASVPDDLFGQALGWLFTGIEADPPPRPSPGP